MNLIRSVLVVMLVLFSSGSLAQETDKSVTCATCHATGKENAPIVTMELIDHSAHQGTECGECHEGVEAELHIVNPPLTDCGICHKDEKANYQQHGIPLVGSSSFVPGCTDCHGSHGILTSSDPKSPTHMINLAGTCGSCHENPEVTALHPFLSKHPVQTYQASVHGKAITGESHTPVSCIHCHGAEKSAHRILPTGHLNSSINHFALSDTCGECHETMKEEYLAGIHGQLMLRGKTDSPTCTNCHGGHRIFASSDSRSHVNSIFLAESTCIPCHQSATLSEVYGMPDGELASFIDPYHGLKSKSDGKAVATCSSCHEAHKILPQSDPESSIHPANIKDTCGQCHEDTSESLTNTPIHFTVNFESQGWPHTITVLYTILITVTLLAMSVYILLDLYRHLKDLVKKEQVRQMNRWDILQNILLLLTFLILVVTGFALRFSDSWWASLLFGKTGTFSERSLIHRTAGIILILTSLMHLFYLRSKNGREFLKQILPNLNDLKTVFGTLAYNSGLKSEKPGFGKFSYMEKFEYWVLICGIIILSVSGVMLWFDNTLVHYLSRTVLEVMRVIHYYEAWLVTLSILIWHLYATIFKPGVYRMNPAWLTGQTLNDPYNQEHSKNI